MIEGMEHVVSLIYFRHKLYAFCCIAGFSQNDNCTGLCWVCYSLAIMDYECMSSIVLREATSEVIDFKKLYAKGMFVISNPYSLPCV